MSSMQCTLGTVYKVQQVGSYSASTASTASMISGVVGQNPVSGFIAPWSLSLPLLPRPRYILPTYIVRCSYCTVVNRCALALMMQ